MDTGQLTLDSKQRWPMQVDSGRNSAVFGQWTVDSPRLRQWTLDTGQPSGSDSRQWTSAGLRQWTVDSRPSQTVDIGHWTAVSLR